MRYRQDLTPAQHVARREALLQIARGEEFHDAYRRVMDDVAKPMARLFSEGERLRGDAYGTSVARVRAILSALGPPILREASLSPSRTRPKGEEHEFMTTVRSGGRKGPSGGAYEIVGLRVWLSRKRFEVRFDSNGILVTRHLLQRAIERGVASWTGRLAEVEDVMLDSVGLVAAWRRALASGLLSNARIALPAGDGLALGLIVPLGTRATVGSIFFGRSRVIKDAAGPSPLNSPPGYDEAGGSLSTLLSTTVDGNTLRLPQIDLRDALRAFVEARAGVMAAIGEAALWPGARLASIPQDADLVPALDDAAADLAALLSRRDMRDALNGRDGPVPVETIIGAARALGATTTA